MGIAVDRFSEFWYVLQNINDQPLLTEWKKLNIWPTSEFSEQASTLIENEN